MTFGRWLTQADMLRVLDTLVALREEVERGWDDSRSLTMTLYTVTGGNANFYRATEQLRPELKRRGLRSLAEVPASGALDFIRDAAADIVARSWSLPPGVSEEEEREQMRREWGEG